MKLVPDVAVTGAGGGMGLTEALVGRLLARGPVNGAVVVEKA